MPGTLADILAAGVGDHTGRQGEALATNLNGGLDITRLLQSLQQAFAVSPSANRRWDAQRENSYEGGAIPDMVAGMSLPMLPPRR